MTDRAKLEAALRKPLPEDEHGVHSEVFDPWDDVIQGIHGSYSSECDALMIEALVAVRDGKTFDLINKRGLAGELALYILSGHNLTEYGTSPRGAWIAYDIRDLLQPLIDRWTAYYQIVWGEPFPVATPDTPPS